MHKVKAITSCVLFLTVFFYITSCEESEDGCLDLLSNNFGFQAVNECDSCCTYPVFSLSLTLKNDSLDFSLNDTIVKNNVDSIVLQRFELLFSDFTFVGDNGEYKIIDTIVVAQNGVIDDYAYIRGERTLQIGSTRFSDTINVVEFNFGFDPVFAESLKPFSQIDSDSKLDEALDSLYLEDKSQYLFGRMFYSLAQDTSEIALLSRTKLDFSIENILISPGEDWNLDIEVDINSLFNGFESNMDSMEVSTTIDSNFLSSFNIRS